MAKEFSYRGRNWSEIEKMSIPEFAQIIPSKERRALLRGLTDAQKVLLKNITSGKKDVKTHCRDLVIIPLMVGKVIRVHSGKEFVPVRVEPEMIGHRLGEFVQTRRKVSHSSPGIGATRSSASLSVR